jgi:hypothetical protein
MRHRKTENTLSVLGGALLGAAAMYLLDPEQGRRRREYLGEVTGEAMRATGDAVGPAWETIAERVRDASGRLAEGAGAFGAAAASRASGAAESARDSGSSAYSGARDTLSDWTDALGSLGRRFTKRASGWGHSAREYSSDAAGRARSYLPWHEEEESHATAYTVAGLSAAALGAGLIYFLDPNNGRRRRALAGQQINRIVNDCGRAFNQSGRYMQDLMNRSRGVAHEARSRFGGAAREPVAPDTLVNRVRSEMGHVVTQASGIDVVADAQGTVTLTGRVLGSEVDRLLTTVNRVPGVNQIVNRLDVCDTTEGLSQNQPGVAPSM